MAAAKGNKYSQKYTPQMIKDLCESVQAYAEEDRTAHFAKWTRKQGYTHAWINRMAEDYPEFDEAYKSAKELMANKLVTLSIFGDPKNPNFNGTHAMAYLPVYDSSLRAYFEWKESIKQKTLSEEEANIIVQAVSYVKKTKK